MAAEFHFDFGIEEFAVAMSLIKKTEEAKGLLFNAYGNISPEEEKGRLLAAYNSLFRVVCSPTSRRMRPFIRM